jgi:hypothetical protein
VTKKKSELDAGGKRVRDIRNGLLLAHVVVSWVVVALVHCPWWSGYNHGKEAFEFWGNDPKAYQTGYVTLAAILAFFFTSYDIVTNSDIQWPPLLASAFALGCASEVTYKLVSERDMIFQHWSESVVDDEMRKRQEAELTAPVTSSSVSANSGVAATGSASSGGTHDEGLKLKIGYGLYGTLYGTFAMVVLSIYLTFFARREEGT